MKEKKKGGGALLGAAFLMATSAIGPGFLTQTATFTGQHMASFGFVILASILLAAIAQMNIWRVLCTTGLRGQDVANKVLPGLGFVVAFMEDYTKAIDIFNTLIDTIEPERAKLLCQEGIHICNKMRFE